MPQENINIGIANQGNGDTLFAAFTKVQANFDELYDDELYGEVNSVIAGTGVSVSSATGNVTVTNSEPNAAHTGDVTGSGALTIADDVISYAKLGTEFTTSAALTTNVDFSTAQVFTKTLAAAATLTFSNTSIGMVKDLVITGDFALTLPAGTTVAGTYDGTVSNLIQIVVTGATEYWYSISKSI